jgi:hypothetical protein
MRMTGRITIGDPIVSMGTLMVLQDARRSSGNLITVPTVPLRRHDGRDARSMNCKIDPSRVITSPQG